MRGPRLHAWHAAEFADFVRCVSSTGPLQKLGRCSQQGTAGADAAWSAWIGEQIMQKTNPHMPAAPYLDLLKDHSDPHPTTLSVRTTTLCTVTTSAQRAHPPTHTLNNLSTSRLRGPPAHARPVWRQHTAQQVIWAPPCSLERAGTPGPACEGCRVADLPDPAVLSRWRSSLALGPEPPAPPARLPAPGL